MNDKTFDYKFVRRIIYRKLRKNIAWAEYDQQRISFNKKIDFALNRLKQVPFSRLKVIIPFWEKYEALQKILGSCNHTLIRDYKVGRSTPRFTPGLIEIYYDECFDDKLIYTLIKKHYGYELGKDDSLHMEMIFVFEKDDDVTICHLYDDRGFHIFFMNNVKGRSL